MASGEPNVEDAVTCICPTTSSRSHFWPRVLDCFRRQSYPHKQLVIVSDGDPPAEVTDEPNVVYVQLAQDTDVGKKRNLACQHATGRWIAHFDDDDLYAPNYLETMIGELLASRATCGKLGDWLVCDVQRGCWGEYLGSKPLEGRFAVQSAMRLLSHGFSLFYERGLAERFPFRERDAPPVYSEPEKPPSKESRESNDDSGSEDSEDEETQVARALGRGSMDDMALLRQRLKDKERQEALQQRAPAPAAFVDEPEDRDFILQLLAAGELVHFVHGRPELCIHVQHGRNLYGTVLHRWVPDPAARIASSQLAELVPAGWLQFGRAAPLPPPMEDPRSFALFAWGFIGRPGHPTMLVDEIREEVVQLASHHAKPPTDFARIGRDASLRALELLLRAAESQKEKANASFRSGELEAAAAKYRRSLAVGDVVSAFAHDVAPPLREKADTFRYALLCNLAQAALKQGNPGEAEQRASAAIPLDRSAFKAWWRRAQAQELLGKPKESARDLLAAWRRAPEGSGERTEIGRALARARQRGDLENE